MIVVADTLPQWFIFTRPFTKGQKYTEIWVLQTLLKNNGYYHWTINNVYTRSTIEAVYKFQMAHGILKWYEKMPGTRWWMWPSTRKKLNQVLANWWIDNIKTEVKEIVAEEIIEIVEDVEVTETEKIVEEVVDVIKLDPAQTAIQTIIKRYNTVEEQKVALQEAFVKVTATITKITDPAQKTFLQKFKTAIQIYLNDLQ